MQAVWDVGRGSAGDVRGVLAKAGKKAKPTTVSTVLRILVDKGFLEYEAYGRTYVYRAAVAKTDYSAGRLSSFIERFFGGSPARLVSFLAEREDLSLEEIEGLLEAGDEGVAGESGGHGADGDAMDPADRTDRNNRDDDKSAS